MATNPYLDLDKPQAPVENSNPYLQPEEETGRNREQYFEGSIGREVLEGVGSGLIGIGEGVIGLGTLGVDLVTSLTGEGTNYTDH
tara:strand:+ start:646 stop:900 length:255 start_codon:yes stop_codon:yes gene_type:complete